ncbi:hypothetical protein [Nubsella zeaxanthinifaciens]|uniref:hypothetical protein n=1 Tax=Nubsella zeaxanthinifaciens TaxID=392412 RepID=UPI000DE34EFB|nr:hypothetical protein [Nubsella zeaxanthinifaciens]
MNRAESNAALTAAEKAGFKPIRTGIGVPDGKYHFATPDNLDIFLVKEISSAKGNFALTFVAGTLKGAEDNNKHISKTFGIGSSDAQMMVTVEHFNNIEPNQLYSIEIANGRAKSLSLFNANIVNSSEVVTKSKQKVVA